MSTADSRVAECIQDDDDNSMSPTATGLDCLGTPVILRTVMEHLSNTELLGVSLVNKLWNYEARSVLKIRGSLIAKLESKSPCQKVAAFASDLRQMNVVPFSGINIRREDWDGCEGCVASTTGDLDPNYNVILDRVSLKHLRFYWGTDWHKAKKCQAFLLAQKILQDCNGNLEEFQLRLGGGSKKFMQQILQDCKFPQLKILDLRAGSRSPGEDCTGLTKSLLSRAPKIQELHEAWWVNYKENVLEGTSAVLVTHSPVRLPYDQFCQGILPSLRLAHLILEVKEQDFSLERLNRITPMLLQNSATTLETLTMDPVFTFPLISYGIRLENVREITLCMDYRYCERHYPYPRVLTLLKAFDYTSIFPNLSQVRMAPTVGNPLGLEQMNQFIQQGNAFLNQPIRPNRATNITELQLLRNFKDDGAIAFLAQTFPNIKKLLIYKTNREHVPYGLIWEHFESLTELVTAKLGSYHQNMRNQNLDSVFCGIFPEEVAQLRNMDDEYLKTVNIVPVMPAITCLSRLTSIVIAIWNESYDHEVYDGPWGFGPPPPTTYSPKFLLSKVTGLIAFARMPSLSVSLRADFPELAEAMSHMKPYARVYPEDY